MELYHHGKLGQHWGIRNGPPYPLNKSNDTVFISGSSKTQFKDSGHYRRQLPKDIRKEIDGYMKKGKRIVVGDAPGIDRQVQDYLKAKRYSNVEIYGPGKKVRYNANKKWQTHAIDAPEFEEMSGEWLAKKDKAMTKVATEGLAVILDEGAAATRKNVKRLLLQNKDVKVYELSKYGKKYDKYVTDKLAELNDATKISKEIKTKSFDSNYSDSKKDVKKVIDSLSSKDKYWLTSKKNQSTDQILDKYYSKYHKPKYMNIAYHNGKPIGFITMWYDGSNVVKTDLAIDPKYRGKGCSYNLVKNLSKIINSPSNKHVNYWEWPVHKDNWPSRNLAENLGFEKVYESKNKPWINYSIINGSPI